MLVDWWDKYLESLPQDRRAEVIAQANWESELEQAVEDSIRAAVSAAFVRWPGTYGLDMIAVVAERLAREIAPEAFAREEEWRAESRRKAKAKIPGQLRTQVFERDEYRCVDCGTHKDLTIDHVIPESAGGPTEFDNLATRCRSCNSSKGTKVPG